MQWNGLYVELKQQQLLCGLKLILALSNLRMFQTLYECQREHEAQIAVKILYLCIEENVPGFASRTTYLTWIEEALDTSEEGDVLLM